MMIPKPMHKRRKPKQSVRSEFKPKLRKQIMTDNDNVCQSCGGGATQIHHVFPRGRGGRGVYTNGMAICFSCHEDIHSDNEQLDYWIKQYVSMHGKDFYMDEFDG